MFNVVAKSKGHYLGPISDTPQNAKLVRLFNVTTPQNALVIPLIIRDRLVSILYIQDQLNILERRFSEVQKLAKMAEMAFTLLILKNKILTT